MADDRAHDALDHLQAAALELIAALRALLDVAEEAVRDPQAVRDVVGSTVLAAAQVAAAVSGREGPGAGPPPGSGPRPDVPGDGPPGQPGEAGVEHIRIS